MVSRTINKLVAMAVAAAGCGVWCQARQGRGEERDKGEGRKARRETGEGMRVGKQEEREWKEEGWRKE